MKPRSHRTSSIPANPIKIHATARPAYFLLKPKLTPKHFARVCCYTHLYSDSTIVLLPDLCNNHKLKQCCSRNNRKIIDSHSTPAVPQMDEASKGLSSDSSSSSTLPPSTSAAITESTRGVTAMTNTAATMPPQPILIASKPKPNACLTANERSLIASPISVGTLLTPPKTPSPVVFNGERSSTNRTVQNGGHPKNNHAYEQQSFPLNLSPKNQNYSKNPAGTNPAPNNLVQDANANEDNGEVSIAIDRNRRKGSYKKRKKMKKREKHN